jgi:hypothetical protein
MIQVREPTWRTRESLGRVRSADTVATAETIKLVVGEKFRRVRVVAQAATAGRARDQE